MSNYKEWLSKADVDYEAALILSHSRKKGMAAMVAYHCQQSAEKYLKAYLILHRKAFPKTHDLENLLDLVKVFDEFVETIRKEIQFLNPYSIGGRYPGEEVLREEAMKALGAVKVVRDLLRSRL